MVKVLLHRSYIKVKDDVSEHLIKISIKSKVHILSATVPCYEKGILCFDNSMNEVALVGRRFFHWILSNESSYF